MTSPLEIDRVHTQATTERAEALFLQYQETIYRRTDRMFAGLMAFQWLAGVAAALWISPRTWIGDRSSVHLHVWAALFLGGAISSLPIWLALTRPGLAVTRHAIAIGQMLTSALLIHLSGGRIETHFHVFGSLAFLAFYRDWRVLVTATVIVSLDHFLRGTFWPQSVFGVLSASPWRWMEHAAWVAFEDVFLFFSIRQSSKEARLVAQRQAELEAINEGIEKIVCQRTAELEQSHKQLLQVSRQAGMAEVATNVLHNVGNVLNSINISSGVISDRLRNSKHGNILKVANLFDEHSQDLANFLAKDVKGRQLPDFLKRLGVQLATDNQAILDEVSSLAKNVDHINDIVATQQTYARIAGVTETVRVTDLIEDAVRMNASALARHDVRFYREYDDHVPEITVEKHKVLQILVNLIRNAKYACDESGSADKKLTARVVNGNDRVRISLSDNGVGVPPENLDRIFNHGFTTRKDGHGFGLHSGALAAKEMGGSLTVFSEGTGRGATFTLELPVAS
jgi:signal transduction histidine kinase